MKKAEIIFRDLESNDEIVMTMTQDEDGSITASTNVKKLKEEIPKNRFHFDLVLHLFESFGGIAEITEN